MNAEDPLFILYTSGSTGKPKGVLHTTGGYLVWAAYTHEIVFDLSADDVYWCTADVGWITGHSYIVYGPLANGATSVMFEGVPSWPNASRFWEVIDKHQVTIFYTAPTAIRALMREGDAPVKRTSRKSLRLLGSVGEPINPEAWRWYHQVVGDERCPIVDTWWQTETGGMLISPLPGATDLKPGSATLPLPGVRAPWSMRPARSWKARPRATWCCWIPGRGRCARCTATTSASSTPTSSAYPGMYFTSDGCRRDADGYYWITGRVDDVINVSGHRIGTAEVESALVSHHDVAEAAVVGFPHDIKGQGIYAYVTLKRASRRPTTCARRWCSRCARRSDRSPAPTTSSGRRACRRPAAARSCAASCARSPRTRPTSSATSAPWPIRRWWSRWSTNARCADPRTP